MYEKQFIERHKKHLDKIPYHLAVILGTEAPDFHVLSKMIFWCFSVGIPNISFYDHEGIPLKFVVLVFSFGFFSNFADHL